MCCATKSRQRQRIWPTSRSRFGVVDARGASTLAGRMRSSSALAVFALAALASSPSPARAQDCTIQGSVAIFMVYQEENPDSVFYSEDGCLAGGGRGSGCCPGAQCRVCEPNAVESTSGKQMRWNSCLCEPCPPGSAQYRAGSNTCVECPAGWYQRAQGQTECEQCPPGTFNPTEGRAEDCSLCPRGTYSRSDILAYRLATTKLYRGTSTTFDESSGAVSCVPCDAGTYQPEPGGKNAAECRPCPAGTFSDSGAAECTRCPAGTYQPHEGAAGPASCLPCQAGKCADAPGSVDCYQCCPIANLACDDYLKRAVGFYGTLDWYSNDGETGRVPTDEYADFLERLCRRGCGKFGVSNWCASGTCATTQEV